MPTDVEIAAATPMLPIEEIAAKIGIPANEIFRYGPHKAKVSLPYVQGMQRREGSKLILVTATSPTPAGEGKTTTTVGLVDGLAHIGETAAAALREPSMGPVFGMKGGAAGGGKSQLNPMTDINLHFTGDFASIAEAHNLLAALIDNHLQQGNELGIDPRRITFKRVLDMNDRALRDIVIGLGGPTNGVPRESGFDIVVASEVMAIFCLATSIDDLKERLGRIVVGHTYDTEPVTAADLGAHGAMTALLADALAPNLVQTLEGNPAFVHGGPFANIAHGCNSVTATNTALAHADWVVTEAGFGADLGAEKFIDLKCRFTGLRPDAAVLVATIRSMKYHGGVAVTDLTSENVDAMRSGMSNIERHLHNLREVWGLPVVVGLNRFPSDTDAEIAAFVEGIEKLGARVEVCTHFSDGGAGAAGLARAIVEATEGGTPDLHFTYDDGLTLVEKVEKIATTIYGAGSIAIPPAAAKQISQFEAEGYGHLPVCIAKTQKSFTTDDAMRGAPSGHVLEVREVRLAAGAGFVVFVCGSLMTMPGLPKKPAALAIDVDSEGHITGLF
ncbi:formate--tetrahydrofolate ligase [Dermacoccus nishinomiyaensis]|uniref:formate--tetrahydrofolate ligase n=1 Tax=Dermacoccus nishinomiyaensis TaxID=1274 RepID=UPI000DF9D47B|nr:formate--tetrahydrofolate ligase [Dermacoccus nishinomiyaensis]MCT1603952.1 formate--tetrahydrofolate ligase [Dermacoccus nishinomiyaensis]QQY24742.1 formate--tetrahydrofolate ligase [Dermacoccus nishinomiyaensis]STD19351.1 Formate--tetrahydrofolate ligase [Dermacoccus nishinomiyaensis]